MTMAMQQRQEAYINIHQDTATEETEMMLDDNGHIEDFESDDVERQDAAGQQEEVEEEEEYEEEEVGEYEEEQEEEEGEEEEEEQGGEGEGEDTCDGSSEDEHVEQSVQADMDKLQRDFPGFRSMYRLIKRIGEGTFSTVFKAEDLRYDDFHNDWEFEDDSTKWTPPPLKRDAEQSALRTKKRKRFVAIKKIYVTSSPARILNELELLHDLRQCPSVCPLITAFRQADQVVAILPYFRHADFRIYFRHMTVPDIAIYLRSLFTALKSVHKHGILHRDIKPTNFLYDPMTQHGVLVDFGLAERHGIELTKPCICHETREVRKFRQANSVWAQTSTTSQPGYPKSDTRPSRRANRAGTRGFRAPEVLFKCTQQTAAIDVWSVGVILLTILSKRFPFFNSADDVEAMIEIATVFGFRRMRAAGALHGCVFETNLPTIGQHGFSMERIILWSTCRAENSPLTDQEKLAVRFLERCLELDPSRRITAQEALEHDLLQLGQPSGEDMANDDEMDMLQT